VTTVVGAAGVPKTVTKQTVILTYQPQQYAVQVDHNISFLFVIATILFSITFQLVLFSFAYVNIN
jgi:hypothetical protein